MIPVKSYWLMVVCEIGQRDRQYDALNISGRRLADY